MEAHVLCIGGEDHRLRIPFLLALRDRGYRVSAAGPGDPTAFKKAGIDFYRLRFGRLLSPAADWTSFRKIPQLISALQPAIIQCFDTKPDLLVPLAARKCRDVAIVSTINGIGVLYSLRSPLALCLRPVYEALQRLSSRSTAVTVFQNGHDQAFFARRGMLGSGRNLVIPGSGIDVQYFDQASATGPSRADIRASLGLGDSEVVITVSRMTRQKGINTLLKAAELVHRSRPGVRFLLVGPRESEGRLAVAQTDIERHAPYVVAVGQRSDVPSLLAAADVFAFPTEYPEGVPRALLEAAIARLPIVTTTMQGCRDVISDGWSGILVPPHAPERLAQGILDLLEKRDVALAMGARASEFARREFNLEITVERYAAVYEQLLSR